MADPLSVAGSVVGIVALGIQVTQSLFNYYAARKSYRSDIKSTKQKLKDFLEILERLHSHLSTREFRANEKSLVENIESHIRECVQKLQDEENKFKNPPVDDFLSIVKSQAYRVAYPLRETTLVNLDREIDEITNRLQLILQLLHQETVDHIQDNIEDIKAYLDLSRVSQLSSEIRSWLKAPDAAVNFNDAVKKKHPRTGLWLVRSRAFKEWLKNPNSFLWIRGLAGCGKSVLCSTAIQFAYQHCRTDPRIGLACFFFTFTDENKQSASSMLRALILQLSSHKENYDDLTRLRKRCHNASPSDQALLACFHQLVKSFPGVYIILDALDESPRNRHRKEMLQVLEDIRTWNEPALHLLVTSRNEVDIRRRLEATPGETIEMKNKEVDEDINKFIAEHLQKDTELEKWSEFHDQIRKALTDGANGVFRWVECQFKELADAPVVTEDDLNHYLQSLPRSLDETYARMIENIVPQFRGRAWQMLILLCYAVRPLTNQEMMDALAIELGDNPRFNPARRIKDADSLQAICPGLTETGMIPSSGEKAIRIAHFSVQEYLESNRICDHEATAQFHFSQQDGHDHIARVCLTMLLEPKIRGWTESSEITKMFPLASYAGYHWHTHVVQGNSADETDAQILQLFRDTAGAFTTWISIRDPDHWIMERYLGFTDNPIYHGALLGLHRTLRALFDEAHSQAQLTPSGPTWLKLINKANSGWQETALRVASLKGHEKTVQLLLDNGADISYTDDRDQSALGAALQGGNEKIFQVLLDNSANTGYAYPGGDFLAALKRGNKRIIQLFQDNGVDINNNFLHDASANGDEILVRALLDNGADVDACGSGRSGDLSPSSFPIPMLAVGQPNSTGKYGTALQAASAKGRENIVQMLLDKGANINAFNENGTTALHAASASEKENIVRMLLDNGADVNANKPTEDVSAMEAKWWGTALQSALPTGNEEIVKILLDNGADVNAPLSGKYGTVLRAASANGNEKIVQMLLANGADVNATDSYGGTALHVASMYGEEEIVRMLLDNGADVKATDSCGGTALHGASMHGKEKIVQMLLDNGADIDAMSLSGHTALHCATDKREEKTTKILLNNGADINAAARHCSTALHGSLHRGDRRIAQILLENGADTLIAYDDETDPLFRAKIYKTYERFGLHPKSATIKSQDSTGDQPQ